MEKQELKKLKRDELLEIMLAQSEEIDRLRARVEELETKLNDRELKFEKIGSIAEASLAVTNIFEEAERSVALYVENIKRLAGEKNPGRADGGAVSAATEEKSDAGTAGAAAEEKKAGGAADAAAEEKTAGGTAGAAIEEKTAGGEAVPVDKEKAEGALKASDSE